jgi:hypothetical protein
VSAPAPPTAAALEAAGWQRGCVADRARIPDLVEMYEEIGFEVIAVPVDLDGEGCSECMRAAPDGFRVLYTRRR